MKRTWLERLGDSFRLVWWQVWAWWRWMRWQVSTCKRNGHDWCDEGHGGRACTYADAHDMTCSQPVYVCLRCGEIDYGEPCGPGESFCREDCDIRKAIDTGQVEELADRDAGWA